jgi:hypothetical protein
MWMKRLFSTSLGLAAAVLLMESLFQLVAATPLWRVLPIPEVALYGPDADTGYTHRVGASGIWITENRARITVSNLGLRDRDRPLEPGPGPRAVVVGNSIIEALQVEQADTSSAVAEHLMKGRYPGAEVVNLGLSGATPAVEVARLEKKGMSLAPTVALVVIPMGDLLSAKTRDDSAFPGYISAGDGPAQLSYRFRQGRGYAFRMSEAGGWMYTALDHSLIATLMNNRKNIGLFAEFNIGVPAATPPADVASACDAEDLQGHRQLWLHDQPAEAAAVRDAFLRDLARIQKASATRIVAMSSGIQGHCQKASAQRRELIAAMAARFAAVGLDFEDLDARIVAEVSPNGVSALHGFGPRLGFGHLNVEGNRVYGEIFAEVIQGALERDRSSGSHD